MKIHPNEFATNTCVVLAATSGIGRAIALRLARGGCKIVFNGRDSSKCLQLQSDLKLAGAPMVDFIIGDIGATETIRAIFARVEMEFAELDILVNNCGGPKAGTLEQLSDGDWLDTFHKVFLSYVRAFNAAVPFFKAKGGGKVVNIVSSSVKAALPRLALSNSLRPAVMGWMKTAALEYAKDKILLNAIAPGKIDTSRTQTLEQDRAVISGTSFASIREQTTREIPLGRYGTSEEIAELAAFLLGTSNTYITGQTIMVDGGWSKQY